MNVKFRYVAKTLSGENVEGTLEAATPKEASMLLRDEGLIPITIEPVKSIFDIEISLPFLNRVSLKELTIATRQLAAMVGAGIPLPAALKAIATQSRNKYFRQVLEEIVDSVEAGMKFSDALKNYPSVFPPLYVSMVEAGETTGELDVMLRRWAFSAEKVLALRRKVRNAMIYPVAVLIIAILIFIFLLVKVVPTFAKIFRESGVELPALTQFVLALSDVVKHRIGVVLLSVVIFFVAFRFALRFEGFRYAWDKVKLNLPIFGTLIKKSVVARFSRTLSAMLRSGINIIDGLDAVARTAGNKVVERSLLEARDAIARGEMLSEALKDNPAFPPMVIEMISAGEKTGGLDEMLEKVAEFYEEEVDAAVEAMTTMIEPIMLIIIGGMIGTIVIALYLPIFKLGSTIR